jgi:hypothetical protein
MPPKPKQVRPKRVDPPVGHSVTGQGVPSGFGSQAFAHSPVEPHKSRSVRRIVPFRHLQGHSVPDNLATVGSTHDISRARAAASTPEHIGADPDILVVEDVARILRCTVDTARRIPRHQLRSICGPGRRRVYLREDVLVYVRSLGRSAPNAELLLTRARAEVLGSSADRVRERSQRRRTS